MHKGNTLIIILVLIGVLFIGGVVAFMLTQSKNTATDTAQTTAETGGTVVQEENVQPNSQAVVDSVDATVVNVSAKNFTFSPAEIKVKKGNTVKIVLNAESGTHDWVVDEFNARTTVVNAGETTEVTFVADQTGKFEYYCSVGNHRQMGMVGTLIVTE